MSYKAPLISPNDFGTAKVGVGLVVTNGIINATGLTTNSYYGKFFSSTTQNNSAANAINFISFPNTILSNGITTSGGGITFLNGGVYTITYEVQAEITSGSGGNIDIWLSSNAADLPNSNSITTIEGGGNAVIINRSFLISVVPNDIIRVKWSSARSNARLTATGAQAGPTRPATNSANFLATLVKAS
jgi:hypothetical protein